MTSYTIFMARTSNADKNKRITLKGNEHKRAALFVLRALLYKQTRDDYEKSVRKDELYIINSKKFQEAISNARASLGLVKGKRKGVLTADFEEAKKEALAHAGLSDEWDEYIGKYITTNTPPSEIMFFKPTKIWVEDINEEDELLIRLKPGLRYEEYRKAWDVFVRTLGKGERLSKSYSNEEDHIKWLEDKDSGMTYLQVATKHYPHNPEDNVEKVKKAILRLRKRLERDK